ncbi:MAG TPA: SdrD B-like domain-containing protein [Ilumatobacteraceae bacterium]|nr:SdrD B-like domain-containing protein [Ilumatobacteraceae bacterium]
MSTPVALALPGDINLQTLNVSPTSSAGSPEAPGQTFTYTIGFSCDSSISGTCDGATIDDLLPQFTDVFGNLAQVTSSGTPSGTAGIWQFGGPAFTGSGTNVHMTGTLNSTTAPGQTYSVTFSVVAPRNMFPAGVTQLDNAVTSSGVLVPPAVSSFVQGTAPNWSITKTGPANLLLGANGTYTIQACAAAASAFPASFTISDLLPAGAHFVSASNGGTAPAHDPADGTTDVVTWTFNSSNHPWPIVSNCLQVTQVVSYTEDPALNNVFGVVKTNTATGTYNATSFVPSSVNTTLRGPITSVNGDKSVGVGGFYVHAGDPVTYNLRFNNSSEVGAAALDSAVTIDNMTSAGDFDLNSIDVGSWPVGVTADVAVSTDGTTWNDIPGSPFSGVAQNVAIADGSKYVRWTFHGPIPVGFTTSGMHLVGIMLTPASPPVTETNCLNVTALRGVSAYSDNGNCANVLLEIAQPDPSVNKTITSVLAADGTPHTATTVAPGDTIAYRVQVSNSGDATADLTDPVVTDCVARTTNMRDPVVGFLGAGWTRDLAYTDSACTTAFGTPLRLVYTGGPIAPGTTVTAATYTVLTTKFGDAEGVTPAGNYPNTAVLTKATGTFNHGTLSSSKTVTVPAYIYLASQKWVLGSRDLNTGPGPSNSRNAGETDPGGSMTWFITVRNKGNVPALNPVYVDVFPHLGDTGVKRIDQTRDSEWAPYLVQPIVTPAGWSVQYSTSSNPCRPEVGPNPTSATPWPPGCQAPNWSTDDSLFALTSYHSIRLAFTGTIPIGDPEIQFSWDMRAPVYDPYYDGVGGVAGVDTTNPYERLAGCAMDPDTQTQDPATVNPCPRAINSVAWAAEADPASVNPAFNPGRLSTEPPRVGIQVRALPLTGNIIGDRVWNDTNFNGLQDVGESGVGGIYVKLMKYDSLLSTWGQYGYTYTDPNGNYLFSTPGLSLNGLPDGKYRVRFSLPSQWYVSPQDADGLGATDLGTPANGNTDSDVPQTVSGTDGGVSYYETADVNLGTPNETDLTWDAGIWVAQPSITIDKKTKDVAWDDAAAGDAVTVLQGRPIVWKYSISNTGNTRLQNVVITDDNGTPGNLGDDFFVTSCTVAADGTNENLAQHSSAVAPFALNRGGRLDCTATGTAGSGAYSNVARVSGTPTLDGGGPITRGTVPPTVTANDPSSYNVIKYDLALAKTVGAPTYPTGNVVYTISVKNQGGIDSGLYSVTDTLPAGMSFVSANPAATTVSAGSVVWVDRPNLVVGATTTFTMTLHIDNYLLTPFRNFAEISDDSADQATTGGHLTPTVDVDSVPDANTGNDMTGGKTYGPVGAPTAGGADNTNISQAGTGTDGEDDADIADLITTPTYDLALSKTANASGLSSSGIGSIVYTITVLNQGNVASGTYTVTDTVPAGLAVTTPVPGGGVVTVGSPTRIVWTGTSLATGASRTFNYIATISNVTPRPYRNFAEISSDSAQALYAINDIDSTPDAITGNDMPGGKTYGPVGNPTAGGADNIAITDAGTGTDGEDDADIADVDLPLATRYDLALAKTVDSATVSYDGLITYTVTVQNQGVLDSRAFTVIDTFPAGLTPVDLDGGTNNGNGTITWAIPDLQAGSSTTRVLTATITDITLRPYRNFAEISSDSAATYSSASETVHDVDSTPDTLTGNDGVYGAIMSGGPIDNIDGSGPGTAVAAAGVGADSPLSGGQDDADIADVDMPVTYDLALIKTGPAALTDDGSATFTITVANQGNVPSGSYSVTDEVPAGLTATAASGSGSLASPSTAVVWNALPSLAPGATATLTLTMNVVDYTLRPYLNIAEITADSASSYTRVGGPPVTDIDSVPNDVASNAIDNTILSEAGAGPDAGFDDEDVATVTIDPYYDLALVKVADTASTTYNGTVVFTISVANQGNVPSGMFTVTDSLPVGVMFQSASSGGTVDADGTHVTWDLPSMAPGATVTVTLTVSVSDITKRPFVNIAEITSDSAASYSLPGGPVLADIDSAPGDAATSTVDNTSISEAGDGADTGFDDEDTATFDVPVVYDLDLVKTLDPGQTFHLGDTIGYTITVSNQGNVPSGAYSIQDALPDGLTFVSASDGATADGNLVTWTNLPSLNPGSSASVTVRAHLDDVTRSSYVNVAEIINDGSGKLSATDSPVKDIDSSPSLPTGDPNVNEDDRSLASLSVAEVLAANTAPAPLPRTGFNSQRALNAALLLLAAGTVLTVTTRRRRRKNTAPVT